MVLNLTFTAIDVETANSNPASICQIGVVCFRDGGIVDQWSIRLNPEQQFSPSNVKIHGISQDMVQDCENLPKVYHELRRGLDGTVLVSHTPFDRFALDRAAEKYGLEPIRPQWLDSAVIARAAWPAKYRKRRWGLAHIARDLQIVFKHHDAVEDARAAGEIVLRACRHIGLGVDEWLIQSRARDQ